MKAQLPLDFDKERSSTDAPLSRLELNQLIEEARSAYMTAITNIAVPFVDLLQEGYTEATSEELDYEGARSAPEPEHWPLFKPVIMLLQRLPTINLKEDYVRSWRDLLFFEVRGDVDGRLEQAPRPVHTPDPSGNHWYPERPIDQLKTAYQAHLHQLRQDLDNPSPTDITDNIDDVEDQVSTAINAWPLNGALCLTSKNARTPFIKDELSEELWDDYDRRELPFSWGEIILGIVITDLMTPA